MQTETEKKFDKDSFSNTFIVATAVCLVCSFLVAGAAVVLKPLQDKNKERDIMMNIIRVAGLKDRDIEAFDSVEDCFKTNFDDRLILLETGEDGVELARKFLELGDDVEDAEVIAKFDQYKAAIDARKDGDKRLYSRKLASSEDIAGLDTVEKISHVYLFKGSKGDSGEYEKYIFPVRGKGLWSILYGFVSVEPDFQTISGLTYYTHGETPGLGGEVDNPSWKSQWDLKENKRGVVEGKQIYDDQQAVKISVVKGKASSEFEVDGLAGATITSNGVTNMMKFWFGPEGFGPYIKLQKSSRSTGESVASTGSQGVSN